MKRLIAAVFVLSSLADANVVAAASRAAHPADTQRLIIQFRDAPVLAKAARSYKELAQTRNVQSLAARKSLRLSRLRETAQGAVVVEMAAAQTMDQARQTARLIADDPAVAHVEPDSRVFAQQLGDPLLAQQWSLPGAAEPGASAGGVNVRGAWQLTIGQGVTVAVIDTGSTSHPDLDAAWLPGYDFIGADPGGTLDTANDGDGRDLDATDPGDWCVVEGATQPSSWHGTAVASVIAARADNGYGIVGAAPGVRVLPVRAIGRCGGYMSDVLDAMRWSAGLPVAGVAANPNPAKVLNLSLGSAPEVPCSTLQQQAVNDIVAANVLIVAAAGNQGTQGIGAPANCNQVLAVAAHTREGALAAYSNFHAAVALTAPGGIGSGTATAIVAAGNSGLESPGVADPGRAFAGTSAATPHVAAAAALLWSLDPARSLVEIRNALISAARPWPAATPCVEAVAQGLCGAGMLDVGAAIRRLGNQVAVDITAPDQAFAGSSQIEVAATARSNYATSQLAYRWTQTSGVPAVLANADTAMLALKLPPYRTTIGLRVTVTDPLGGETIDDATVLVNNEPVAQAIAPIQARAGESIVLLLGATDPDGDAVRYTLLQGPAGLTVGRNDGKLQWTAGAAGTHAARIGIEDAHGQRGKDIDVDIEVTTGEGVSTASPLGAGGPGSGGGGAAGWLELGLLGLALASLKAKPGSKRARPLV